MVGDGAAQRRQREGDVVAADAQAAAQVAADVDDEPRRLLQREIEGELRDVEQRRRTAEQARRGEGGVGGDQVEAARVTAPAAGTRSATTPAASNRRSPPTRSNSIAARLPPLASTPARKFVRAIAGSTSIGSAEVRARPSTRSSHHSPAVRRRAIRN